MDFYDSWYNISMSRLLILAASDFWDIVTLSYGITDRQTDRPTDAAENPTLRLLHSHFNRGQCVTVDKLRSIVMSASVCVCVCVCLSVCPQAYFPNQARDHYQIFIHVAYGRGSALLWRVDEILRGKGNFGVFLPHWQCIVQHSIWDPYKNSWTDGDAV